MTGSKDRVEALPEHVRENRRAWDRWAAEYVEAGEENWASSIERWGIWGIAEDAAQVLTEPLAGKDAIELGCGTAYVSAWLARRGARPVGIDNSPAQLRTARRLQAQHGLSFPLLLGNAESVPFPDASFDYAISEYGACLWADPYRWVPEAARLLRPGGALVFLVSSLLVLLCSPDAEDGPATERLQRPGFGVHRVTWPGHEGVEFFLSHSSWIRVLRQSGFEVEDVIELRPPEGATTRHPFVSLDWARRWPCEEVWKVRQARGGRAPGDLKCYHRIW